MFQSSHWRIVPVAGCCHVGRGKATERGFGQTCYTDCKLWNPGLSCSVLASGIWESSTLLIRKQRFALIGYPIFPLKPPIHANFSWDSLWWGSGHKAIARKGQWLVYWVVGSCGPANVAMTSGALFFIFFLGLFWANKSLLLDQRLTGLWLNFRVGLTKRFSVLSSTRCKGRSKAIIVVLDSAYDSLYVQPMCLLYAQAIPQLHSNGQSRDQILWVLCMIISWRWRDDFGISWPFLLFVCPSAAEESCLVGNPVWFHFLNQVLRDGAQGEFRTSLSVIWNSHRMLSHLVYLSYT